MATAIKRTTAPTKGGQFRIIVGAHLGQGPKGCECEACLNSAGKNHVYRQRQNGDAEDFDGDIIDSPIDLAARFNQSTSRKFERIDGEHRAVSQPPAPFPLDKMTVAQLMAVAAEEGVDLKGASAKEAIIKAINAARQE